MSNEFAECVIGDRRIPMEEVVANGKKVATGFADLGLKEGDAIAILMRNDSAYLEAVLAAGVVGVYAISINWHFKGEEIRYILEDSGAKLIVIHADLLAQCQSFIPSNVRVLAVTTPPTLAESYSVPPEETSVPAGVAEWEQWRDSHSQWTGPSKRTPGTMTYTSGTTGKPKGVRRESPEKFRQIEIIKLIGEWFKFRPEMSTIVNGPLYHSVVSTFSFASIRAGASIVLMPKFNELELLETIEREKITHLHLVPTMFVRLLRLPEEVRSKYDLSSLEMVIHGAAPCPTEVKRQIIDWFGPVIYEYYGATEFGMVTRCDSQEWLERPGTTGKAWQGREIEIHDDNGKILPAGEVGEVYVSLGGVANFTYHNQEDARREIDRNGLITVGDAGYLDKDGYLFLTDRKRDMIISGGVNIYPAEIEGEMALHPQIVDSAVFSIPDDEYGEKVIAVVETTVGEQVEEAELLSFLKERLANYKVPRQIIFEAKLPRDDAGKIRKRELRDPYWAGRERNI